MVEMIGQHVVSLQCSNSALTYFIGVAARQARTDRRASSTRRSSASAVEELCRATASARRSGGFIGSHFVGPHPHYFLNLYNADGDALDPEGADYRDLAAARAAGIHSIRSLLSAEALEGQINLHGYLEIVDRHGRIHQSIAFADAIRIIMS